MRIANPNGVQCKSFTCRGVMSRNGFPGMMHVPSLLISNVFVFFLSKLNNPVAIALFQGHNSMLQTFEINGNNTQVSVILKHSRSNFLMDDESVRFLLTYSEHIRVSVIILHGSHFWFLQQNRQLSMN